jgi:Lon-like ATP-dependent protease
VTIATAVYSALLGLKVDNKVAMTGELSIRGLVKPVGGVVAKVEAARQAGAEKVLIPAENYQEIFREFTDVQVIPVERLEEVFKVALADPPPMEKKLELAAPIALDVPLSATTYQL